MRAATINKGGPLEKSDECSALRLGFCQIVSPCRSVAKPLALARVVGKVQEKKRRQVALCVVAEPGCNEVTGL